VQECSIIDTYQEKGYEVEYTTITTAEDCTEQFLQACEDVYEGFFADEPRIDWEGFMDRLERYGYDMGSSMDSPAIKVIKKHIKSIKND
jgi:hypothetical protein